MDSELAVKHVCLPVISLLSVVGNGMLIFITVRYKHLRTVTNFFIISLALSDLLMGLVFLPLLVAVEEGVLGNRSGVCLIVMCLGVAQVLASCLTLMAIAVERYIAIRRPLKHHSLMTSKNALLIILFCWSYAFVVGCLPLLGWNALPEQTSWNLVRGLFSNGPGNGNVSSNQTTDDDQRALAENRTQICRYQTVISGSFAAFMYPGHFVCLWVVMFILYGQIYMRTRKHSSLGGNMYNVRRWSESMRSHTHNSRRARENWRAMRILAIVVGYFLFSWLPVVIWYGDLYRGYTIEYAQNSKPTLPYWFYNIGITLAFGNSAVNPFLYGFGCRSVRKVWLRMLRCNAQPITHSANSHRKVNGIVIANASNILRLREMSPSPLSKQNRPIDRGGQPDRDGGMEMNDLKMSCCRNFPSELSRHPEHGESRPHIPQSLHRDEYSDDGSSDELCPSEECLEAESRNL